MSARIRRAKAQRHTSLRRRWREGWRPLVAELAPWALSSLGQEFAVVDAVWLPGVAQGGGARVGDIREGRIVGLDSDGRMIEELVPHRLIPAATFGEALRAWRAEHPCTPGRRSA